MRNGEPLLMRKSKKWPKALPKAWAVAAIWKSGKVILIWKTTLSLPGYAAAAAVEYLGEENVWTWILWMAAEDFSYYSHEIDACFYRLGTRNEAKGITSGVHTPTFDIDETALKIGAGLLAWLAVHSLGNTY